MCDFLDCLVLMDIWYVLSIECFPLAYILYKTGFPSGSDGRESACNAGDPGLIPRSGRSPGGGHGNPLQYSCLKNPHGQRSLTGAVVHRVTRSQTRLNDLAQKHADVLMSH